MGRTGTLRVGDARGVQAAAVTRRGRPARNVRRARRPLPDDLELSGTATFFESLGFYPGRRFVVVAVLGECGGGLLFALGLFQPAAAASIIAVMIVAIATVHWGNGLLAPNGIELPLLYLTAALSLGLTGPGAHSVDALLGLTS